MMQSTSQQQVSGLSLLLQASLTLLLTWQLLTLTLADAAIVRQTFIVSEIDLTPDCVVTRKTPVVNGRFPGPSIIAREGDTIMVTVVNKQSVPVTIHWHGITQEGSQWMDGVPMITQCPIAQNNNFTYVFRIVGQWGTFWWHAHNNMLRSTVFGALIVLPSYYANPEPYTTAIANDMTLMIGDWFQSTPADLEKDISGVPYKGFPLPDALHINGYTPCSDPMLYLTVQPRRWYRLRVINVALMAQLNFIIANHRMVLFEAEGGYLQQVPRTSLDIYPGMSYSVLFYTNQPAANYWITSNGRFDVEQANLMPGLAVLNYAGVKKDQPLDGFPVSPTTSDNPTFHLDQERAIRNLFYVQPSYVAKVDRLFVFGLNFHTLPNGLGVYSLNNVSFSPASTPHLLADYNNVTDAYSTSLIPTRPPAGFENSQGGPVQSGPGVIQIPYNSYVQVVIQNHLPPGGNHPFHLHGYQFHIVGRGTGTFNAAKWWSYRYNLVNPPHRNVVPMFEGQWVAIRFRATNPGQWVMHCHFENHAHQGMLVTFKVGGPPGSLSPPPADYPTC